MRLRVQSGTGCESCGDPAVRAILPRMADAANPAFGPVQTRWSRAADALDLAEIHRHAWRYAYAGIIPGLALERMIARRGPAWWEGVHDRGFRALVLERGGSVTGYATLGRSRATARARGEIYELYLRPEAQGCGYGRRLFDVARGELVAHGLPRLMVWALTENSIACRFYRAMGGIAAAEAQERFCGVPLTKVGFAWD
jgi:ribosomal protein S18 acetylase RimI-like enzyme